MTSDTLRAIRALNAISAQDALDILQCLAATQPSFDGTCLDDCIRILEECVSEESLSLADFAQEPRSPRGEYDAQTLHSSGNVPSWLRVAI